MRCDNESLRDPWQHTLQLLSDDDNVDLLTEEIISIFSFLLNKILTQFQNLLLCQISLYWLYCTRTIPIIRQHEPTRSSPYFMFFPKLAWKWKEEATILKSISEKTLFLNHQRTTKHGQYCSQTVSGNIEAVHICHRWIKWNPHIHLPTLPYIIHTYISISIHTRGFATERHLFKSPLYILNEYYQFSRKKFNRANVMSGSQWRQ